MKKQQIVLLSLLTIITGAHAKVNCFFGAGKLAREKVKNSECVYCLYHIDGTGLFRYCSGKMCEVHELHAHRKVCCQKDGCKESDSRGTEEIGETEESPIRKEEELLADKDEPPMDPKELAEKPPVDGEEELVSEMEQSPKELENPGLEPKGEE